MKTKTKEKLLENTRQWRKTKRGLVTNLYNKMKYRNNVDFNLEWLHEFANCKKFNRLYNEWVKSGYNKQFKPTIDRISNKRGYDEKNVQWLSWAENRYKQSATEGKLGRKPAVLQMKGDKVIKRFKSQRDVVRQLGVTQSHISNVLNGRKQTAYGYKFIYEHPNLLEDNQE